MSDRESEGMFYGTASLGFDFCVLNVEGIEDELFLLRFLYICAPPINTGPTSGIPP